ncbi:WG repeat-containing protein [Sphingobacteriaceae bacterium WQ 2009]|uniref:WG repeat-containing protein n=1 Tax=Rhinopithecimicrobium faecis TaxID=2820698 RepID=A0A8T4H9T0_9SPHI|nr:WG repeat-containing protein [Sphingobacteriaceae bacterium WQ 2009]
MKNLPIYLAIFLSGILCSKAQNKAVKIAYSLNIGDSFQEKSDLSLMTKVFSQEDLSDFVDIWASPEYTKITSKTNKQTTEVHLFDKNQTYILDDINKQYIDITSLQSRRLGFTPAGNLINSYKEPYTISYDNQIKKDILGYICYKATIHFPAKKLADGSNLNEHIEVWYTKDLPVIHWTKFYYLNEIPGAPLKIESEGLGLTARTVSPLKNDILAANILTEYSLSTLTADPELEESPFENTYLGEERYSYFDRNCALFGLQDRHGNTLTKAQYKEIHGFKNNLAIVADTAFNYGLINSQGKEVLPCQYQDLLQTKDGLFIYEKNQQQGFLSPQGNVLIPAAYTTVYEFQEQLALVKNKEYYGIINAQGTLVVPLNYEMITAYNNQLAIVIKDQKYGLISTEGAPICDLKYEYLQFGNEELLLAKKGGKYGFINFQGAVVIPFDYQIAQAFQDGKALVTKNGSQFYISPAGEVLN